jgi:hypothetical protein
MPEALPELVWFSLLFFCFAFVWCARKLIAALFKPVFSVANIIPLIGPSLDSFLHSIESDVDNALGDIEHNIDALMGASWHRFAELNEWLWKELKKHTLIGQLLSAEIKALKHAYAFVRNLAHEAKSAVEHLPKQIRTLEREYKGIEHKVKALEKDFAHGIGDDVLPRLKSLDKEVTHIIHSTIPAIRAAESDADRAISDLYSWAKGKASLVGVGTFSVAVATALAALGLGWLRCSNNPFSKSKTPCSLWDDLAKLLGLAGILAVGFTFQEFVDAASEVAAGIGTFVGDLEAPFVAPLPPLPPPQG